MSESAVRTGTHPIAVEVHGLKKSFGGGATRIQVLHGIDMEARAGELMLLVGPSGCGKTTLLTLIAGLLDGDEGSISVFGTRIDTLSAAKKTLFRKQNLGFIFQQFNLLPTLSAAENAAVPMLIKGESRSKSVAHAKTFLERVGLGHRLNSLPTKLSGGEQQRVAIARALVADPRLLICDEPTASLDGETGAHVMEILRTVALDERRCIIVVTHDSRIFHYGDRMARMLDGRILSIGPMNGHGAATESPNPAGEKVAT